MTENIEQMVNSGADAPSGYYAEHTGSSADYGVYEDNEQRQRRGFAAMNPNLQREIARMGGRERGRQMHEEAMRRHGSRNKH